MKELITQIKNLATDKSLLLVEDDMALLLSLKKLLEHFFGSLYTASSVEEALALYERSYKEERFLVISDINLGKESGVDLAYALRRLDKTQRIIAISAMQDSRVFIDSIECGIDRFLLKPIKKEKLFETLIAVLEKMEYDAKLQESQKLLEASREYALSLLEEQDRFIKNAIHEIHTPLAVIITNIDLLRMQGIENRSLQAIEAGSRSIQNSYEDMTYLMKKDRDLAQKESVDLVAFVRQRCDYFECIAGAHDIAFAFEGVDEVVPAFEFNATKLARIVDNTLSNAIKYAQKPSTITLSVKCSAEQIIFSVQNFGVVIQDTKKIFERFYRESSTKGGYGLGLYIVWLICEEESVKIDIVSNAKDGTTFSYLFNNPQQEQKK